MLHFFYDSLDTLKKVKKPTWKEVRVFTIQVFLAVVIGSILFFVLDNFWGNIYKQIFQTFGSTQNLVDPSIDTPTDMPISVPSVDPILTGEVNVPVVGDGTGSNIP